jgi:SAM-dependent methyltransferase
MKLIIENGRLASPGVWERVIDLLGSCSGLTVLDTPAGVGKLSGIIHKQGAYIVGVDVRRDFETQGHWVCADLNKPLPFSDNSFDRVVSVEGIEHLENPFFLMREFARVIKKDGFVIVSTPNTINLRSRLKFLLTGNMFWFGESAIGSFGHIMPISPPILRYACRKAGFSRVEIHASRCSPILSVLAMVFQLFSWALPEKENSHYLLAGEILIFKCFLS